MVTRRRLLAGTTAGLAALAGCLQVGYAGPSGGGRFPDDLPVPESALVRGAPRDAIPAITDPVFAPDWSGVSLAARTVDFGVRRIEPRLAPFDRVVGIVRDGHPRAYPLRVLGWHEVVNGRVGEPLLVSYCPLCGSAVVAGRRVAGEERSFGVSGLLWNDNLVMYDDRTESLWSQVAATAVRGPLTGAELELVPATLARWDEWRAEFPDTGVLLPPPYSGTVVGRSLSAVRDYTFDPYGAYETNERVGLAGLRGKDPGDGPRTDDRLPPKVAVLGIARDGTAKAYPRPEIEREGVVNDRVGDVPVVVAVTSGGSLVAYERTAGGRALAFRPGGDGTIRADGSCWRVATGEALDGPHRGTTLDRANDRPAMFWFSWADFHPETAVYGDPR